jgi:hypothetical protein
MKANLLMSRKRDFHKLAAEYILFLSETKDPASLGWEVAERKGDSFSPSVP